MTIYEITEDYMRLLELAEEPDIDPQVIADTMEGIEGEFEVKAEGYAKVLLELDSESNALDEEIARLKARKDSLSNNAKRIKETLQQAMQITGKVKFKTPLFSFNIQKNAPSLIVDDWTKVPAEYLIEQDPKVDKMAIKKAIKSGEDCSAFARLEQGESLRIR